MSNFTINGKPATQQEMMLVIEALNSRVQELKAQGICIPEIPYNTQDLTSHIIYQYLDGNKNGIIEFHDTRNECVIQLLFDEIATILSRHGIEAKTTLEASCENVDEKKCNEYKQERKLIPKEPINLDPEASFLHMGRLDLNRDGKPDVELQAIPRPGHENELDVYASVLPEANLAKSHGSIAVKIGPTFNASDIIEKILDEYRTRSEEDLIFSGEELHLRQKGFPICGFLAALMTIGADALLRHIQENADGSYRVTFENKSALVDRSDLEMITHFRSRCLFVGCISPNSDSDNGKLVQIMEAALYKHASLFGLNELRSKEGTTQDGIEHNSVWAGGLNLQELMSTLTGKNIKTFSIDEVKKYLPLIFEDGAYTPTTPIVLGANPYFMDYEHSYAVVGYRDGKILYKNPWYGGFTFEIALEDLQDKFFDIFLPEELILNAIANQDPAEAEAARIKELQD